MKKKWKSTEILVLVATIVSALIPILIILTFNNVNGKITDVKPGKKHNDIITIEYYVDGERYTTTRRYSYVNFSEGDEIRIAACPFSPSWTFAVNINDLGLFYVVSVIGAILLYALRVIIPKRKQKQSVIRSEE